MFFHLEAKHYWTMINTIPVLLWIIRGKWCFPCSWCMCSQDSVLWGFTAEELGNKPCTRPLWQTCSTPCRGSRREFALLGGREPWVGRLHGEMTAVPRCCAVYGQGRARLWDAASWDKGQQAQHSKFSTDIKVSKFFFFFSFWQSYTLVFEKVRNISIFGDSKKVCLESPGQPELAESSHVWGWTR